MTTEEMLSLAQSYISRATAMEEQARDYKNYKPWQRNQLIRMAGDYRKKARKLECEASAKAARGK